MIIAIVLLSLICAALLVYCLLLRTEMKSIAAQTDILRCKDTNSLIKSVNGTADVLINSINTMLTEAREDKAVYTRKNHAVEQMMTNISHDLRTPLTSALGYISLVRSADISEDEKQRELEIIEKRLVRLEELINSFFEFSKIVSGDKKPELSELDAVALLQESIVHYFDDYESKGRSISLDCSQRRIMLVSNRSMLLRIFDNLIGNSLKHGSGELSVRVEDTDSMTVIFSNPTEQTEIDTERIFDEFYTTDISRTKGSTGLGLAIAKQFTDMLGGTMSADFSDSIFTVKASFPKK